MFSFTGFINTDTDGMVISNLMKSLEDYPDCLEVLEKAIRDRSHLVPVKKQFTNRNGRSYMKTVYVTSEQAEKMGHPQAGDDDRNGKKPRQITKKPTISREEGKKAVHSITDTLKTHEQRQKFMDTIKANGITWTEKNNNGKDAVWYVQYMRACMAATKHIREGGSLDALTTDNSLAIKVRNGDIKGTVTELGLDLSAKLDTSGLSEPIISISDVSKLMSNAEYNFRVFVNIDKKDYPRIKKPYKIPYLTSSMSVVQHEGKIYLQFTGHNHRIQTILLSPQEKDAVLSALGTKRLATVKSVVRSTSAPPIANLPLEGEAISFRYAYKDGRSFNSEFVLNRGGEYYKLNDNKAFGITKYNPNDIDLSGDETITAAGKKLKKLSPDEIEAVKLKLKTAFSLKFIKDDVKIANNLKQRLITQKKIYTKNKKILDSGKTVQLDNDTFLYRDGQNYYKVNTQAGTIEYNKKDLNDLLIDKEFTTTVSSADREKAINDPANAFPKWKFDDLGSEVTKFHSLTTDGHGYGRSYLKDIYTYPAQDLRDSMLKKLDEIKKTSNAEDAASKKDAIQKDYENLVSTIQNYDYSKTKKSKDLELAKKFKALVDKHVDYALSKAK